MTSGRRSQSGSGSACTWCLTPTRWRPPGQAASRDSSSAIAGLVRSVQPTTPATSGSAAAMASISGVSAATVTVCTSTVAVTPADCALGRRSSMPKLRRIGAIGGPAIHDWSRTARSQTW